MSQTSLSTLLQERLPPEVWQLLLTARDVAARLGLPLFLVGGTVRDVLLGRPTWDVDLVVEGEALPFAGELAEALGGRVAARSQFGTVQIIAGRLKVDVARARQERYPRPGALPLVSPCTIEQDLARRDFSIHAMAVILTQGRWSELVDPFGGQKDLSAKLVRFLHEASFQDDPTRMLRALRYATRLSFALDPGTEAALKRDVAYLDGVSGPRKWKELERVLHEPTPESILLWAQEVGLLSHLHPALRTDPTQVAACVTAREEARPHLVEPLVYFCLFAYGLSPQEQAGLINGLHLPGVAARALEDISALQGLLPQLAQPGLLPSHSVALMKGRTLPALQAVRLVAHDPLVRERLGQYLARWRALRPRLAARDFLELGVPPGPAVGRYLQALLEARLDGLTNSAEDERGLLRRWLAARARERKG